jgi:LacI family transcriptional regulator
LHAPEWDKDQSQIAAWIATLPRPLALMGCNDLRGQHVLDACRRIDLAVPEEVAVIGVDDEQLLCELADPPLSTVVPASEQIGYQAAELLDRLMSGRRPRSPRSPRSGERTVQPSGVVTRHSTDVLAIADPDVAAAVRYIREHACGGITVPDVLRRVPLSRSVLEHRFRAYLGRSPQAEIRAVRIKRGKQLLVETDLPLYRIAQLSGFEHAEYFSVVFKRMAAQTPGGYRRQAQAGAARAPAGRKGHAT